MGADERELLRFAGALDDGAHRGMQGGPAGKGTLRRRFVSDPRRVFENGADDAGEFLAAETVYFTERNAHAAFVIAAANRLKLFVAREN
jgi:hypothetical protein